MSDVACLVQATEGNFDLPAVSAADMIWAESTIVVDVPSLPGGEPSNAVEPAIQLLDDGIVERACRLIRTVRHATMPKLRFTNRFVFFLIGITAAMLASVRMLNWRHQIDANSEIALVCDSEMCLTWSPRAWEPKHSGVVSNYDYNTSPGVPTFDDHTIPMDQPLVTITLNDNRGMQSFQFDAYVHGRRDEDWSNYLFSVACDGGGNVDAAIECRHEFSPEQKSIELELCLYFNSRRVAKTCQLDFRHDGSAFVLVNNHGEPER